MFAEAQKRVRPEGGAQWISCGGAVAAFNGIASPVTQTFGLGLFEDLTDETLNTIESFFFGRGAATDHEVSPFAGIPALELLRGRSYTPIELSNVMYRPVAKPAPAEPGNIRVYVTTPPDEAVWIDTMARGWQYDNFRELGTIAAACEGNVRFLAEIGGQVGAAGTLSIHQGVALFAGAATLPEMRRRGLQSALIDARMQHAFECGCDLLMIAVLPGSDSQRNAERNGFRVAYTRTKWRLPLPLTQV